jgi:HEAT repeat protein
MSSSRFAVLLLGVSVLALAQQEPKVVNSQFHTEPASSGLSATVDRFQRSNGPLWLGYEVPALPRTHFSVCSGDAQSGAVDDSCCGEYQLEESDNSFRQSEGNPQAQPNAYILIRLDQGAVSRVRFVSAGCRLNAGGLSFTWLTGVQPEDSVAYLGTLAAGSDKRLADEALAVLSLHATPKATSVLASLTSSAHPFWLREKAAFWLGVQRGHDGLLVLKQLAQTDTDTELRKKLTFDISTNSDPAAIDELLRMAKSDADPEVRGQALFWVAHKAGQKAVAMLNNAVENDPEVAVKRKAVFALSQLPKDEAVPQLLHVAQTNADPQVRKEAIFWLGQTHDPRALEYFEQILER